VVRPTLIASEPKLITSLGGTLLEPGPSAPEPELYKVRLCPLVVPGLVLSIVYDLLHVVSLRANNFLGHLEFLVILDLDIVSASKLARSYIVACDFDLNFCHLEKNLFLIAFLEHHTA
jgi:hypothetical protein